MRFRRLLLAAGSTVFFTSGVASADGEGSVSAEAVKAQIRSLIDAEDPKAVLSDDALVERIARVSRRATWLSAKSPALWPKLSLIRFIWSTSMKLVD